jgi:tetratricopeptide (TPR) repeat protein
VAAGAQGEARVQALCAVANATHRSHPDTALLYGKTALANAQALGNPSLVSFSYYQVALAQTTKGQYIEGYESYQNALQAALSANDTLHILRALNGIGGTLRNIGDYVGAMETYNRCLTQYAQGLDSAMYAALYNNIGLIQARTGRSGEAINFFTLALQWSNGGGYSPARLKMLSNLAASFVEEGRPDSAIRLYDEIELAYRALGDRMGLSTVLHNRGVAYSNAGNPSRALHDLSNALEISRELGDQNDESLLLSALSDALLKTGQPRAAVLCAQQAYSLANTLANFHSLLSATEALHKSYAAVGNTSLAYRYLVEYTSLRDSALNDTKLEELAQQKALYQMQMRSLQIERERFMAAQAETEARLRNVLMIGSGVLLFTVLVFSLIVARSRLRLPAWALHGLVFFAVLLLFEWILVFCDPYFDAFTEQEPFAKLLLNLGVALALTPLHISLDRFVSRRLKPSRRDASQPA